MPTKVLKISSTRATRPDTQVLVCLFVDTLLLLPLLSLNTMADARKLSLLGRTAAEGRIIVRMYAATDKAAMLPVCHWLCITASRPRYTRVSS